MQDGTAAVGGYRLSVLQYLHIHESQQLKKALPLNRKSLLMNMNYRDAAGAETTSTFVFDSAFYNKEIVNHANSDSEVVIRVLDVNGNIVIDNLEVQPGHSVSLDQLDDKTEYRIEAKITEGKVILNIL